MRNDDEGLDRKRKGIKSIEIEVGHAEVVEFAAVVAADLSILRACSISRLTDVNTSSDCCCDCQ